MFSGAIWVGAEAIELGLADGLGDIRTVLRERFGEKVKLRPVLPSRPSFLSRLLRPQPFSPEVGLDPQEILATLEARAAWARLGL